MTLETFFEKFELFADAPDAVAKMRELVLELAVQGKLSEQQAADSKDAAWLKLVEQLDADSNASISDIEPPFVIPRRWRWTTLERLGDTKPRNDAPDSAKSSFVPMTLIPAEYGQSARHEERPWGEIKKGYTHFQDGDVVMAKITPCFENGKSAVMNGLTGGFGAGTTELHVFRRTGEGVLPEFVILYLKTRGYITRGIPRMTGSAGQKRVPSDYFARSPFPLPPLAEQKRIVAKVDELMALCDRLEAQQQAREAQASQLARASLARFADAPTPANLELLFHSSFPIPPSSLRQSILTLAVQGKLVPQDPNDTSAAEMLESDAKLPDGHVRRRKIMKRAPITSKAEMFPELPPSWEYATVQTLYDLNMIVDYADGNHGSLYPRSSEFGDSGVTFVTARDIENGRVSWESCARLNEDRAHQLTKGWAQGGDVLLTHNATVGRVAKVEREIGKFLLGTSATFYRLNEEFIDPSYFYHVLCSPTWQAQLEAIMEQTTRNQVSIQKQAYFQVPLPPLAEQRRIAAKVDELMAWVDALETQLAASRAAAANLLSALVAELTHH